MSFENLQEKFHELTSKFANLMGEKSYTNNKSNNRLGDKTKLKEFFDRHHLPGQFPYEAFDEEREIFINKRSIGFILNATPLTGATPETEDILMSLLVDSVPTGADVHFMLVASDKIGHVFDAFENSRSGHGEIYEWLAKKRTDFLKKGTNNSLAKGANILLRDFRIYISISIAKKNTALEEQIKYLKEIRDDFKSSLGSLKINTQNVTAQNLINILNDLIYPRKDIYPDKTEWNEFDPINIQLMNPEYGFSVQPNKILISNEEEEYDVRCFTATKFPKKTTQWKMTESIGQLFNFNLQIPCQFVISFCVRTENAESSGMKTQLQYLDKDSKSNSPLSRFNPNFAKESEDWRMTRERLQEGDKNVKVFYQVVLYADPNKANSCERKLKDLYKANGWVLLKESYVQLPSWYAMFPMMMTEGLYDDFKFHGRLKTMQGFNAVTISPLQGEWKGTKTPSLILPGRRGQIATWSQFDNEQGNYNVSIAAKSGSGKSVLTQEIILSQLGSGGKVWVIDVGRSYQKTCEKVGGEFIEFDEKMNISINPFTHIKEFDTSIQLLKPLAAQMARPIGNITDEETAWLEKALKAVWEDKGNEANFTDVANWLNKQPNETCKNLELLFFPYTKDGMYGKYFEGPCNIRLDNSFIVLELEELKPKKDLQKIVLFVLMYHISERMYLGERSQTKVCIIDEAWDLFDDNNINAAKFIETGYRRARRHNAGFITITQSINDYYKNPVSFAAYENSDYQIIMHQSASSIDELKNLNRINLDEFTEKLYKSITKTDEFSECLIKSPSGISIHRVLLDNYSRIMYSSKGKEFQAVKNLQSMGYTLNQAIEMVAEKFKVN